MTRVGNVEQVLLLLREQLRRADRGRAAQRGSSAGRAAPADARPLDRVRALAALESLDEGEVRRAVVRGILTEAFGEAVANDAPLQRVADDVLRIIDEMPGGPELIGGAVAQLKETRR